MHAYTKGIIWASVSAHFAGDLCVPVVDIFTDKDAGWPTDSWFPSPGLAECISILVISSSTQSNYMEVTVVLSAWEPAFKWSAEKMMHIARCCTFNLFVFSCLLLCRGCFLICEQLVPFALCPSGLYTEQIFWRTDLVLHVIVNQLIIGGYVVLNRWFKSFF